MKGSIILSQQGTLATSNVSKQVINEAFERLGYHFNKDQKRARALSVGDIRYNKASSRMPLVAGHTLGT